MSSISVAITFSIIKGTSRGVFVKACIVSFFKDEMGISLAKAHNSLGRNREPNLQILLHINERIVKLLKHNLSRFVPSEPKSKLRLSLVLKSKRLDHEHLRVRLLAADPNVFYLKPLVFGI